MRARQIAQRVREAGALYHRKLVGEYRGQAYYRPTATGWQVCAAVHLYKGDYDLSGWMDTVFNMSIPKVEMVHKL